MHLIWDQKPKAQVKERGFNMQIKGCVILSISNRMKEGGFGCMVFMTFSN